MVEIFKDMMEGESKTDWLILVEGNQF